MGLVLLVSLTIGFGSAFNYYHPKVCTYESTISQILEIRRRDAVILLADGNRVTVRLASFRAGDKYCAKWERK